MEDVYELSYEEAMKLIEEGDINLTDQFGNSFLHYACDLGYLEVVKLLIKKGAIIDIKNCDGFTPLHIACMENNIGIVNLLVEEDCNLNIKDAYEWTPLYWVCYYGFVEILEILVRQRS